MSASSPAFPDPIPSIIPFNSISLLAGAPSIGKTALIAGLLRNLKDGRPVFGHQPSPLPGLGFINTDRSWAGGAGTWFNRAGYPEIPYYSLCDDDDFHPRRLRRKIERVGILFEFIDKLQLPPGSAVCVDPIALFLGGNLLDYDSCAIACHEIRKELKLRQFTMLANVHSGKLKADKKERYLRIQDQFLGSTAIFGFTDTQMYLATPAELGKPYYQFFWQSHLAPAETFTLERDEQGLFIPYVGADNANQAKIYALFPEDGSPIDLAGLVELAEAIPLSRATVKRILDALLTLDKIERIAHGFYRRKTVH